MPVTRSHIGVEVATVWTDPSRVRDIDAPAVSCPPDPAAWTAAMGTDERRDLHGRVVTQALRGDPVLVVGSDGAWARVIVTGQPCRADPCGYPGWVPWVHLIARRPAEAPRLFPAGADVPGTAVSGPALVDAARLFLGLDYLWSGTSPYGVDCSGLVTLVHRHFGIGIPRDAGDQVAAGVEVPPQQAGPGDLLYFDDGRSVHHVAMAVGDGTMLHAPYTGATVCIVPIDTPPYGRELCAARRFR